MSPERHLSQPGHRGNSDSRRTESHVLPAPVATPKDTELDERKVLLVLRRAAAVVALSFSLRRCG